uniref:Transposase (Putative), gypsy type n=1 Tax=Tanacetum cinerariifolium TaxID=118510 RepID=A0A699IWA5_TANCI|nr:hypothetical protein [Tanacetum cinerariifolium]
MDLFAFIRHSDPTKVRVGEIENTKREVKLLMLTEGRIVSLDPPASATSGGSNDSIDKLFDEGDDAGQEHSIERDDVFRKKLLPRMFWREDYRAAISNVGGKSLATIRGLIPEGSSVPSRVTEPSLVAFVTPTPDGGYDGPTNSVFGLNLRTRPPGATYVVSSGNSHHLNSRSEVNPFSRSPVADAPVMTIAITTTVAVDASAVPPPKVRIELKNLEIFGDFASTGEANANVAGTSKLNEHVDSSDSFYASQDLDSETLHRIYVPKWNVTNDSVLEDPTTGLSWGGERDTEIAHLKSLLSLKEAEAAEAICLRGQLSVVKAADAAKGNELRDLQERKFLSRDELSSKVASLESERDRLADQSSSLEYAFELFKGRMEAMQDEQEMALGNRVAELDAQLLEMAAHLEKEFYLYPRFLTAISGRRDLSVIEAYDPSAKAKYVDVVSALRTVDFSLLSVLKSKKDASIVDLMDSFHLEVPLAEIPGAEELQPSPKQLMLPIHRAEDNVVLGETSLSFSFQVVHSQVQRVRGKIMEKRLSLKDVMVVVGGVYRK